MAERRYTVLLYAAVLTAVVATFGVYRVLQNTKAKSQIATRPVVVAAKDLTEGASLNGSNVEIKQFPVATVPADAYAQPESVANRVTGVAVFKGEPIVPGRLAPAGTGPGLEVKIAPGKRAMAVKINDVAGLSGLIQPNSRVDVLVTLQANQTQNTKEQAKMFMNNMRVLSVGTQVERGDDGKAIQATTATLEVTPEQAEQLAVAVNQGTIQLVLRGYGDPDSVTTPGATSSDVLAQLRSGPMRTEAVSKPERRAMRPKPATAPAPAP